MASDINITCGALQGQAKFGLLGAHAGELINISDRPQCLVREVNKWLCVSRGGVGIAID